VSKASIEQLAHDNPDFDAPMLHATMRCELPQGNVRVGTESCHVHVDSAAARYVQREIVGMGE
jgi:hypothetical protein